MTAADRTSREETEADLKGSMITVLLYLTGFACIGVGIPVDGLPGAALALAGMALIWVGWSRVIRKGRAR